MFTPLRWRLLVLPLLLSTLTPLIPLLAQAPPVYEAVSAAELDKAPSVADGIALVEPPAANATGGASLTYPIKLPPARQDMAPALSIDYSSDHQHGWLGRGWDLGLPTIDIETRWGVPRFDASDETETYLLEGEMLAPVAHRGETRPRTANLTFYPRVEREFQRITRHGNNPRNYWWEIRFPDGMIEYYGGTPAGLTPSALLTDAVGNISSWALVRATDIHGNRIDYHYQNQADNGRASSTEAGKNRYPDRITYNGFNDEEGPYEIDFIRNRELGEDRRPDVRIDFTSGYKQVTADLLRRIDVRYRGALVRHYELTYKTGVFDQTLLTGVTEFGSDGGRLAGHDFDYYELPAGDFSAFGPTENWNSGNDNVQANILNPIPGFTGDISALGGSASTSIQGGAAVTIGPIGPPASKEFTVGGTFGAGSSEGKGLLTMVDINGDLLPDKVFRRENALVWRKNLYGEGTVGFGPVRPINGITEFSVVSTTEINLGFEANITPFFAGYENTTSRTSTTTYFTDFNGDDLIDILHRGRIYFNHLNASGDPTFTLSSGDTPSPIVSGAEPDGDLVTVDPAEQQELIDMTPKHDVVRSWEAPFTGTVSITGNIQLVAQEGIDEYMREDGVRATIETGTGFLFNNQLFATTIPANDYAPRTPTGVDNINVLAGQRIYFRLQSVFDGAFDRVSWDPEITYVGEDPTATDVNGLPVYRYKASEDFLLASCQTVVMPLAGRADLRGTFSKPVLTDTLHLELRLGDFAIRSWTFPPDSVVTDLAIENLNFVVGQDQLLQLRMRANASVDWTKPTWTPVVSYVSADDGTPVISPAGESLYRYCPAIDYTMRTKLLQRPLIWQPAADTYVSRFQLNYIDFDFDDVRLDRLTLSVRSTDTIYLQRDTLLFLGAAAGAVNWTDTITVEPADSVWIEVFGPADLEAAINASTFTLTRNGNPEPVTIGKHRVRTPNEMIFGPQFRGWGQFVYRGADGLDGLPIQENLLALPNPDIDEEDIEDIEIDPDDPDFTEFEGLTDDPTQEQFIVMVAEAKDGIWRGYDNLTLVGRDFQSSSRLGEDDVILTPDLGTGGSAPPLTSISKMNAIAAGAGFGPASLAGSAAWNTTTNLLEVMDLNGDRYPDLVTPQRAQYTTPYGGLSTRSITHGFGNHVAKSMAIGGTAGGKFVDSSPTNSGDTSGKGSRKRHRRSKTTTKNQGAKAQSANESAESGGSISVNFSVDDDYTVHSWLDINGDGLTDKVWDNGDVAFNHGYRFGPRENWGFADIRTGTSIDYGGGGGINISNNSFAAGFAVTRTDNYSKAALQDINGDGLADALSYNDDTRMLRVALNTGTGFAAYIDWARLSEPFDKGDATAESLNFAFTVCIPIFFIRICVNPSGSTGRGASRVLSQFNDIDGDGLLDELGSTVDNELKVRRSTLGKVNLLRQIQRPLGATIALDYAPAANADGMPFTKWLLTETRLNDGVNGDGPAERKTRHRYEDPRHERHEREFFGFAKVIDEELDTENGDALYRREVTEYANDNFYNRNIPVRTYTEDAAGNRYRETEFNYVLLNPETQTELPPNLLTSDQGRAFPSLLQRRELYYEGETTPGLERITTFTYDSIGQVLVKRELGNGSPEDELRTEFDYHPYGDEYLADQLSSLKIYAGGELKRHSEMDIDARGNIRQLRQYLDEQTFAVHDYTYDDYGNVTSYQKPPNATGQRMTYAYEIDSVEHMYPVRTEDSYGYVSTAAYEFRYGQEVSKTDINGHTVTTMLDEHGRIVERKFPMDSVYSYRYAYFPDAAPPYAKTDRFDPETGDDLPSYAFLDGLGRLVQEQHLAVIGGSPQLVASGRFSYDAFDRPVVEHYPGTTSTASIGLYAAPAAAPKNVATYDVLDRQTSVTLPDNATTMMAYGLTTGPTGENLFQEKMTDALGFTETTLTNERGRREAYLREADTLTIQTLFDHNAIGELLTVTDHGGFRTIYEYDRLSRRIATTNADAGRVEKAYDLAGNLVRKMTPNLREVMGEDGAITYRYDYERLTGINYPINFQNKIELSYGGPDARFNRRGRVVLRQDASGGEEYFYDEHGQLRKTIRTLLINESTARTFVSEMVYDSWGREQAFGYPDGEWVDYGYNAGGQLATMKGEKDGNTYDYLKAITYDEFGRITGRTLGNDSREAMAFDPQTQRPASIGVRDATGQPLQDLRLRYDLVGNLESSEQSAAATDLGAAYRQQFAYDPLQRLTEATGTYTSANGTEDYVYLADHDGLYNQTRRELQRTRNGEVDALNSFDQSLTTTPTHPHRVDTLGGRTYNYDANGNLLGYQGAPGSYRYQQSRWDEENRLMEFSDNGTISRYTYGADGHRAIQSTGDMKGVFTDGAPAGFISHTGEYVAYVSPYFTFTNNSFTKHYFIRDQRVLTKEGTGEFNNTYWFAAGLTAGDLNYTARMNDLTQTVWDYYVGLGLPPGPPTLPGYYGQPGVTGDPLPTSAGGDFGSVPGPGVPGPAQQADTSSTPGTPTWYASPPERDEIGAGFGYEGFGVFPEVVTSYYHTDQLGNVTWVTDGRGEAAAFRAYLPTGELLIEQVKTPPPLEYSFNGKEEDQASGLHFFGARYLEAESGRWLSLDPLAEAYPGHNPYAFGLHNPLRFVDPDGREAVTVDFNSSGLASIGARAYAQGSSVHLMPGQEKHLPHEAWHVVQQNQGRVRPTLATPTMVNDIEAFTYENSATDTDEQQTRNITINDSPLRRREQLVDAIGKLFNTQDASVNINVVATESAENRVLYEAGGRDAGADPKGKRRHNSQVAGQRRTGHTKRQRKRNKQKVSPKKKSKLSGKTLAPAGWGNGSRKRAVRRVWRQ